MLGNRRVAAGGGQPRCVPAGRRGRDLLAQDRADGELGCVDRAGHPASRRLAHQGRQYRIAPQQVVHRDRVGVKIE